MTLHASTWYGSVFEQPKRRHSSSPYLLLNPRKASQSDPARMDDARTSRLPQCIILSLSPVYLFQKSIILCFM